MRRKRTGDTHEDLAREEEIKPGSNRAFGFVFTAVFGLIGLSPLWHQGPLRWWSLGLALAFLAAALLVPRLLSPLNRVWLMLGLILHAVVNPIVMALVFFTTVTPIALIMRARGKDPLRLRRDPDTPSYWIERQPPGPMPDTMPRQF